MTVAEYIVAAVANPFEILRICPGDKLNEVPYLERISSTVGFLFNDNVYNSFVVAEVVKLLNANGISDNEIKTLNEKLGTTGTLEIIVTAHHDAIISIYTSAVTLLLCRKDIVESLKNNSLMAKYFIVDPAVMTGTLTKFGLSVNICAWLTDAFNSVFHCIQSTISEKGGMEMLKLEAEIPQDDSEIQFDIPSEYRKNVIYENLCNSVNDLDKQDVKLKGGENQMSSNYDLDKKVQKYRMDLVKELLQLNGIKPKKYLSGSSIYGEGVVTLPIDKKFKKSSKFFKDKKDKELSDPIFHGRFITYLISDAIVALGNISKASYDMNGDGVFVELESKNAYANHTKTKLIELMHKLMNGELAEKELLYIEEIFMLTYSNTKKSKARAKLCENINIMYDKLTQICSRLDMRFSWLSDYSDAAMFDDLLKIAYFVSTHDQNMSIGFKVKDEFTFRDKELTHKYIRKLGDAILTYRKEHRAPAGLRAFVNAHPIIPSELKNINESEKLSVGAVALYYLGFISGSKDLQGKIDLLV